MESLINRRSIRKYTTEEVNKELLHQLLEAAERTPTMGNLQLYSVIITRQAEMKSKLAVPHFHQPMVKSAPVLLTFCADVRRTSLWAENRQATPGFDNLLSFMNATADALLYCQTFCNIAEEVGLGTCFLGTSIYNAAPIIEILNLPALVFPVATISLGWPDEQPEQSDRLPLAAVIHEETYRDYTPESIDRYYIPKEQLPENKHYVDINHKDTLAQIFTDIRYTKKDNETFSRNLFHALIQQGFLKDEE